MRARIRALIAIVAVLGLVTPAPAAAQAPQAASATATPQYTTPQGGTLPLSLDEAVARALENNADIAVERYNPELSAQDVRGAEGYYDPFLFATLTKSSTDTKGTNLFSGGATVNTKTGLWNFGRSAGDPDGRQPAASAFNNNKRDTNNAFSTFNPVYNSSLAFNLTQPLLKNFGIDRPRLNLKLAKKSREITDVQFRQTVINTVAVVKGFYYELLYAIDNLAAAQKNLQLAKKLLEENEIRVKVGTMAPLDVVTAQSEVASREEGVIVAENALAEAEDNLKRVIFPLNDPLMWHTRIAPTDRPTRRAHAGGHRRRGPDRTREPDRHGRRPQEPGAVRLQPGLREEPAAAAAGPHRQLRRLGRRRDPDPGRGGESAADAHPRWLRRRGLRGVRLRLPDLDGRLQRLVRHPQPQRQGQRGDGPAEQGPDARVLPAPRAAGRGRGAHGGPRRRVGLQAGRLDARRRAGWPPSGSTPRRRSSPRACPRTSSSRRPSATWPRPRSAELRAIADYRKSVINYQRVQEAGVGGTGAALVLSGSASNAQGGQAILSGAASSSANQF